MSSVGKISLDLNVNSKQFNKQVNGIQKATTKAFGLMSVAVGNIISNMVQNAVKGIGDFVKDSIDKGSELSELQNVVDSVFETMSDKVNDFAKNALDSYGLAEAQAKRMMGTYGAMSKSFGFTEDQAYDMSAALTALTGDVASFYNLDHDVAYTKMKSVFTGETESLKELGVVMTQTALDQFAMANGFNKTTKDMSEQEKVALRMAFVQDKLKVASGDFLKTQDQWANQTRILTGQFDSFKAALGSGFINVLTPLVRTLNEVMAKLVQAAQLFDAFTAKVMGVKKDSGVGSAMMEVAEAAEEAASSTDGIEEAASGAAGSAKKAQQALMGFDEINKLTKTDSASGSSDGLLDNMNFGNQVEEESEVAETAMRKIKDEISAIIELLKQGFKDGLGSDFEASISRIKGHLAGIGESIKEIFTDKEVVGSAKDLGKKVIYSIGQIAGSAVSIGQSIAEALVGGLDKSLEQSKEFIKQRFVGILDAASGIWETAGELSKAFASIYEVFRSDTSKQIVGDILSSINDAYLGIIDLSMQIGRDIINAIAQPIIENKDALKGALESIMGPISVVTSTISTAVRETFDTIFAVYQEKVQPLFQSIGDGLSAIVSTMITAWETYISPILSNLATKFSEVWVAYVQPAITSIIEFVGKLANGIKALWEGVLVPLIQWLTNTLVPIIAPILETLGTMVMNLFGTISQIVKGVFDVLGGLIDFIVGVFTGDWDLAWEGIKSVFTGIWDAIVGVFRTVWEVIKGVVIVAMDLVKGKIKLGMDAIKGVFTAGWTVIKNVINTILGGIEAMVNGVINGINKMTSAMNSLSFDVPDWVPGIGGGKFGFSIPALSTVSLPRLAEGGFVRANQPQPVIVGDNKTQGEIIAPENKILEITLKALESFFGKLKDMGTQTRTEAGDIIIPIYLDGSLLDEVIVTAQERQAIRSGGY